MSLQWQAYCETTELNAEYALVTIAVHFLPEQIYKLVWIRTLCLPTLLKAVDFKKAFDNVDHCALYILGDVNASINDTSLVSSMVEACV